MYYLRKSKDRGHFNHGWLDTSHTFSFSEYHDPEHMGFRVLRVINEDVIAAGAGFPTHGHRDMEIISYMVDGALEHRDTLGNTSIISPGEVQRMSAGSGIKHSEFNHNKDKTAHLIQIWILTEKEGLSPSYGQISYKNKLGKEKFILVGSHDGRDGSVSMNQNVNLYVGNFKSGESMNYSNPKNRHAWIQMVKGQLKVNGQELETGDGLGISSVQEIKITAEKDSEFLFFDMP